MENQKQIGRLDASLASQLTRVRIFNSQFEPDPKFGSFRIAGESFELMDGLFGMAVSPRGKFEDSNFITPQNERKLYFHALASGQENAVPLRTINDPTIWASNVNAQPSAFKNIGMRNTQTAGEYMKQPHVGETHPKMISEYLRMNHSRS